MEEIELDFNLLKEFDWDEGNKYKNWEKHKIHYKECEEVFLNFPIIGEDEKHSVVEKRYYCLGETEKKKLFISFTARNRKIRVISARPQSRKERTIYEKIKTSS